MKVIPQNTFKYKVTAFIGKKLIAFLEIFVTAFSKKEVVFSLTDFKWAEEIEKKYADIRNEYAAVANTKSLPDICDISEEQYIVIEKNYWRFLPLYIYGVPIQKNLALCPNTAKIIELIPNKTTVFFSSIKPGTFIKPHRGAYKGYLRYHLGVQIPEPDSTCGLKILETVYHWHNGKSIIFDDTYLHEAWNNSNEERVVLYADFIRPMPRFLISMSKLLTRIISKSPFVQNSITKLEGNRFDKEVSELLG